MSDLTHLDDAGAARMVDISDKAPSVRFAHASCQVQTRVQVIEQVRAGAIKKGDVLAVARVAGMMAAKKTSEWIPLCHPLALSSVEIDFALIENMIQVDARVGCTERTGVEMEALTAASAAALTIYDMCKALDKGMVICQLRLEEKTGGKSGPFKRQDQA